MCFNKATNKMFNSTHDVVMKVTLRCSAIDRTDLPAVRKVCAEKPGRARRAEQRDTAHCCCCCHATSLIGDPCAQCAGFNASKHDRKWTRWARNRCEPLCCYSHDTTVPYDYTYRTVCTTYYSFLFSLSVAMQDDLRNFAWMLLDFSSMIPGKSLRWWFLENL